MSDDVSVGTVRNGLVAIVEKLKDQRAVLLDTIKTNASCEMTVIEAWRSSGIERIHRSTVSMHTSTAKILDAVREIDHAVHHITELEKRL